MYIEQEHNRQNVNYPSKHKEAVRGILCQSAPVSFQHLSFRSGQFFTWNDNRDTGRPLSGSDFSSGQFSSVRHEIIDNSEGRDRRLEQFLKVTFSRFGSCPSRSQLGFVDPPYELISRTLSWECGWRPSSTCTSCWLLCPLACLLDVHFKLNSSRCFLLFSLA